MSEEATTQEVETAGVNEVSATHTKTDRKITVNYDFGANLDEAVEKFGSDAVFGGFIAQSKINLQAVIRRMADAGKSDEEIQAIVDTWKPGVSMRGPVDPKSQVLNNFSKMSAEEQAEIINQLRQQIAAQKG